MACRVKDMIDFPFVAPFLCFFLWTNKERKRRFCNKKMNISIICSSGCSASETKSSKFTNLHRNLRRVYPARTAFRHNCITFKGSRRKAQAEGTDRRRSQTLTDKGASVSVSGTGKTSPSFFLVINTLSKKIEIFGYNVIRHLEVVIPRC